MTDYISREKLLERIDGIWDCADMVFEPNDHCCRADNCASCKWRETKNAIRKIAANIPAADVRPVKWIPVTERLPRDRQFVLVYCGDNKRIRPSDRFDVAILLGDSIFTSLGVTHWMPLPEPPKEG